MPKGGGTNLDSLTGLRFVAALLVFGAHLLVLSEPPSDHRLLLAGRTGVSFFFILSGFVLTWSWRPGGTLRDFYQRRFARVYPAHAAVMLLLAALAVAGGLEVGHAFVGSVFLVQSWVPDIGIYYGLNGVAWSLSCEVFFYLLFPFVLPVLTRLDRRQRRVALGLLLALIVVVAAAAHGRTATGSLAYWAIYVAPPVRFLEFVIGMIVALDVRDGEWRRLRLSHALALATGAFLVAGHVPDAFSYVAVTALPYAVLVGAAATADLGGTPSVFRNRALVRLGVLSFAFYLVHQELMLRWNDLVHAVAGRTAASFHWAVVAAQGLGLLAATVAVAWLLHTLVERPFARFLRPRRLRLTLEYAAVELVPSDGPADGTQTDSNSASTPIASS